MAFRNFSETDIFDVYRKSYRVDIPWKECLDGEILEWFNIFERATNCSKTLCFPALLALTSSLVGPDTGLHMENCDFSTVLNQYLIAVCDPGGGKSNTYNHIINPVLDNIYQKTGKQIQLENYTGAGIQKHQIQNSGYGIITGDEGHRFLSNITVKQMKGESERALLCKMWGGKGDNTVLAMSKCVRISHLYRSRN